ncbi:tyrosine-type recombinase/integrase [Kocuria oceani]|uniref:Tyrosine-type recombinase/integrase n=1 Tax=Kocuria oceani TaxID=988827 RepID=A0ABV9TQ08_9MICC|nr:site-specific integrase [Kocuria oceani]
MAAKHITPSLGAYPVDTLERADVSRWVNGLEISGKTKRNVHSILSAALTEAEKAGIIPGNVAKGIRMPSGETRREPVFLTRAELETIADTVPDDYSTLVHFLAGTGARWGEVTALDVRDVDLTGERGVVSITKAWKRDRGQDVLGAPKMKRGRRSVTIGPALTEKVRQHIDGRTPGELLFQRPGGGQLTNYWFFAHVWNPTLKDLADELPARPRVHDLRHTHASWLIQAGVPLPVIQRRLGHESITVTSDTYGHLTDDADRLAADTLDGLDG